MMSLRRSFNTTSAAREIKDSPMPLAISPKIFIDAGMMIIPSVGKEPLAIDAPIYVEEFQ